MLFYFVVCSYEIFFIDSTYLFKIAINLIEVEAKNGISRACDRSCQRPIKGPIDSLALHTSLHVEYVVLMIPLSGFKQHCPFLLNELSMYPVRIIICYNIEYNFSRIIINLKFFETNLNHIKNNFDETSVRSKFSE